MGQEWEIILARFLMDHLEPIVGLRGVTSITAFDYSECLDLCVGWKFAEQRDLGVDPPDLGNHHFFGPADALLKKCRAAFLHSSAIVDDRSQPF